MKKILALTFFIVSLAAYNTALAQWHIETIDHDVQVARDSGLGVNAEGKVWVVYKKGSDLVAAEKTETGWQKSVITSIETDLEGLNVAVDTDGRPHICFVVDYQGLYYASYDGSQWQIQSIDPEGNGFNSYSCSITLDQAGHPHISYEGSFGALKYASFDGANWQTETVLENDNADDNSLALDGSGQPHIAYRSNNSDLKCAYKNGSTWQAFTIDDTESSVRAVSLALDQKGRPHLSAYTSQGLAYFTINEDGAWEKTYLDPGGAWYTSLALDPSNLVHIAYFYMGASYALKYASFDGQTWKIETIETNGDLGRRASLGIDKYGIPHISYVDYNNGTIKYASHEGNVSIKGDVSGDNQLNITDALLAARCALGLGSPCELQTADVNCDGLVTILDALLIARRALNLDTPNWCY